MLHIRTYIYGLNIYITSLEVNIFIKQKKIEKYVQMSFEKTYRICMSFSKNTFLVKDPPSFAKYRTYSIGSPTYIWLSVTWIMPTFIEMD